MGYDSLRWIGYTPWMSAELRIPLRLDNHLGFETQRDRDAVDSLRDEILALIDADPDYRRVAILGVEGGR